MKLSEIVEGLHNLGVAPGDCLLVHSSLKSFGWVDGGADTVIDALLQAVGPAGTIMVPTLTGQRSDSVTSPPVFDVKNTPCWTGTIPETFRLRPDALRSLHPTHSAAAIGPHTEFLLNDHLKAKTPCGPDSPYMRLAELDGKVLFLGADLESCTLLHTAEELAGSDYHMQPEPVPAVITDNHGNTTTLNILIHDWDTEKHFQALEPVFLEKNIMKTGRIGSCYARLLGAKPALRTVLKILKNSPRFLCRD